MTGNSIPLPSGWVEEKVPASWYPEQSSGVFARCFPSRKLIQYYTRWWWTWTIGPTITHERVHAWGLPGCKSKSCLMFEGGDDWKEKLVIPLQLAARLASSSWFCLQCGKDLQDAMERGQ